MVLRPPAGPARQKTFLLPAHFQHPGRQIHQKSLMRSSRRMSQSIGRCRSIRIGSLAARESRDRTNKNAKKQLNHNQKKKSYAGRGLRFCQIAKRKRILLGQNPNLWGE